MSLSPAIGALSMTPMNGITSGLPLVDVGITVSSWVANGPSVATGWGGETFCWQRLVMMVL